MWRETGVERWVGGGSEEREEKRLRKEEREGGRERERSYTNNQLKPYI